MNSNSLPGLGLALLFSASLGLAACGGGSSSSGSASSSGSTTSSSSTGSSGTGSSASSGSTTSSSGSTGSSTSTSSSGTSAAAALAAKIGKPSRLLVGLGTQGSSYLITDIQSQSLTPDIIETYLVGAGANDWTTWASPSGAIVSQFAANASAANAVPMFTLYQMAQNGDSNLSGLTDSSFMSTYWANVKLMYQKIGTYGKPALVNLEPDFWGYVQDQATSGNGATRAAVVTSNPDCASLTNDVTGVAGCLIAMARKYAPQAYVGFPPSDWGASTISGVVSFMHDIGAQNADFVVIQTLDRDAGCFEAAPSYCQRAGTFYWDETNQTTPNFSQHLANALAYHNGLGGLPLIWWQTPLGVPSTTPGGSDYAYRDNREHYFLTHPSELTAVGGLGVVFGTGEAHQTSVMTDGGQFKTLSSAYFNSPTALP